MSKSKGNLVFVSACAQRRRPGRDPARRCCPTTTGPTGSGPTTSRPLAPGAPSPEAPGALALVAGAPAHRSRARARPARATTQARLASAAVARWATDRHPRPLGQPGRRGRARARRARRAVHARPALKSRRRRRPPGRVPRPSPRASGPPIRPRRRPFGGHLVRCTNWEGGEPQGRPWMSLMSPRGPPPRPRLRRVRRVVAAGAQVALELLGDRLAGGLGQLDSASPALLERRRTRRFVVLGGHLVDGAPTPGPARQVAQRHLDVEEVLDPAQQRQRRLRVGRLGDVVRDAAQNVTAGMPARRTRPAAPRDAGRPLVAGVAPARGRRRQVGRRRCR